MSRPTDKLSPEQVPKVILTRDPREEIHAITRHWLQANRSDDASGAVATEESKDRVHLGTLLHAISCEADLTDAEAKALSNPHRTFEQLAGVRDQGNPKVPQTRLHVSRATGGIEAESPGDSGLGKAFVVFARSRSAPSRLDFLGVYSCRGNAQLFIDAQDAAVRECLELHEIEFDAGPSDENWAKPTGLARAFHLLAGMPDDSDPRAGGHD